MSDRQIFELEGFYWGMLVAAGRQVSAAPGVIARTPGITPARVAECLQAARLSPPSAADYDDTMPGAIGLFRGQTPGFILAKAQMNDAGLPQSLYLLLPTAPLRALGGNVLALGPLGMQRMPAFSTRDDDLPLFALQNTASPSADEQIDALHNLILVCQDSFSTIEALLAGLVQGWPLAIVNSPRSLELRLRFVQGLLSLLPVPARVGITFATHVQDFSATSVQIKFSTQPVTPAQHIVYDWTTGSLTNEAPTDPYARYMVAQLRLDASLVLEQTAALASTTAWRATQKETLGQALSWGARRAALDQTVQDGQPADRELVEAILREDPTLSTELRIAYARHLLAFALALDEPESADIIPTVALTNSAIAKMITEQLTDALRAGQSAIVYALTKRWLQRTPEAAALRWHPILHSAAKDRLKVLLQEPAASSVLEFLHELRVAPPVMRFDLILPEIVPMLQPLARAQRRLAEAVFLTAVETLPAGDLYRLLSDRDFLRQLPPSLQNTLHVLQSEPRQDVPPNVLDQGARAFGDGYRMVILTRLVEWAVFLQRLELVDLNALRALLVMAQSPQADRYHNLIQHIIQEFTQVTTVQNLPPPGPRILAQLLLETGSFEDAVALLEFYQYAIFGLDRLDDFVKLVEELFRLTALSSEDLSAALKSLEGSQIRPEPRAMIFCGALQNREWSADQNYAAHRLTTMIFNDTTLIAVIGPDNALNLLKFHARPQNALDTLRVGAALVEHTLGMGIDGATLITRMWPLITWDSEVTGVSLELLRRYVRGMPIQHVPAVIAFLGNALGNSVADVLRATYLMRLAMDKTDLLTFAERAHSATTLFADVAAVYHTSREFPTTVRLRRDLDTMTGGLSEPERSRLAANILTILHQIAELKQKTAPHKRDHAQLVHQLIEHTAIPENGIDLLRFMGGAFSQHQRLTLVLEREAIVHISGNRSAAIFLRETDSITRLLGGLQRAFDEEMARVSSIRALASEVDSLWNDLSLYNQRRIREQFAEDCQHLADVIDVMTEHANLRILSDTAIGRQLEIGLRQPDSALAALRWIAGYFARKHVRTPS